MKRLAVVALAACCIVTAAAAQPMVQRINERQARYKQMGAAMKALHEQLRASNPSLPVIRRNSALITRYAPRVLGWFPRGSGPEAGARTRALPEIWSDGRGFTAAGARLVVAARGLDGAARGGDMAAIRVAMRGVAGACSGCHDNFRGPEQ